MTNPYYDLLRKSVTQPGEAARVLASVKLSTSEIAQAALLLALVSVVARYGLLWFLVSLSPTPAYLTDYAVWADVAMQFGGIYLAIFATVILGRAMGAMIPFPKAAATYIWFNLLVTLGSLLMLGAFYLLGGVGMLVSLAVGIWALWAMAHFWSMLLGRDNLLLGLVLGVVSILLASTITVVVVGMLGLPVMEISTDV